MTGNYEHSLDSAGRLIVPSKLREQIGTVFYLAPGTKTNLTIYPLEAWERLKAQVAEEDADDDDDVDMFFGLAQRCEVDKQWRFPVSAELQEYADIERDVVISGDRELAKIWKKEIWQASREKVTPEKMRQMMRRLKKKD